MSAAEWIYHAHWCWAAAVSAQRLQALLASLRCLEARQQWQSGRRCAEWSLKAPQGVQAAAIVDGWELRWTPLQQRWRERGTQRAAAVQRVSAQGYLGRQKWRCDGY